MADHSHRICGASTTGMLMSSAGSVRGGLCRASTVRGRRCIPVSYFRRWRLGGTWASIHAHLRELTRVHAGRDPTPSAAKSRQLVSSARPDSPSRQPVRQNAHGRSAWLRGRQEVRRTPAPHAGTEWCSRPGISNCTKKPYTPFFKRCFIVIRRCMPLFSLCQKKITMADSSIKR
jgi:hypothetical protein